jgi:hypothetical protein
VREAVWSAPIKSTKKAGLSESARRNLQREHLNRLAVAVVRSSGRADVRALVRQEARDLLKQLERTAVGDRASTPAAHVRDSIDTLRAALQATVVRASP